ncbi:MAG: hypothetical protein AB7H86_00330 [Blastocatellales bacterium]
MRRYLILLIPALVCLAGLTVESRAQTRITLTGETASEPAGNYFRYVFENPRFTVPYQEIVIDETGKGTFRYHRKDAEEISLKVALSDDLLSRIRNLFDSMNFLNSTEEYQHKKDFSHLGTMTIARSFKGASRSVKFNYTSNQSLNELVEIFRRIATQETRVFELETVRSNDPISTPAQMRLLESELRSKNIADPGKLIPLLEEIRLDEGVPLITRNHAERLIKMITKK